MDTQASKNFTKKELSCKCCGVFGVSPELVERLQNLRDLYTKPIIVNSAYRCAGHNYDVGGVPDSYHVKGVAVDIHCVDNHERHKLLQLAFALGFTGIKIYKTFLHLDLRPEGEKVALI